MKLSRKLVPILLSISNVKATLEMTPTFQTEFKSIAFSAGFGGSSHYNWVLSVGEELVKRGHQFTLLTATENIKFGKQFDRIKTVDLGPMPEYDKVSLFVEAGAGKNMDQYLSKVQKLMFGNYERDYKALVDHFISHSIELVICDHLYEACADAANTAKIPFIITACNDLSKETAAPYVNNELFVLMNEPTTEHESFLTRFYSLFIKSHVGYYRLRDLFQDKDKRRRAIGVVNTASGPDAWQNSLKLVNVLFGYNPARPIGPLVEFIGPIISKRYTDLTPDLKSYFSQHQRVAFVAFGQMAVPTPRNMAKILKSLLESIESGYLDAFLWSTVNAAGLLPDTIITASGKSYSVDIMLNGKSPYARMVKWAPQAAILFHPSVTLFVSHGGLSSWYESMYAGKPMLVHPFFADQPGNAHLVEKQHLGAIFPIDSPTTDIVQLIGNITTDAKIKQNVKRMQALTQIHSNYAVERGANLVEEVAYTHQDGKLPYRESADKRMSYIKAHNLDLYLAWVALWTFSIYGCYRVLARPCRANHRVALK